jgi:hypothetical protein
MTVTMQNLERLSLAEMAEFTQSEKWGQAPFFPARQRRRFILGPKKWLPVPNSRGSQIRPPKLRRREKNGLGDENTDMNVRATLQTQDLRKRGTGILACVPIFSRLLRHYQSIAYSAPIR